MKKQRVDRNLIFILLHNFRNKRALLHFTSVNCTMPLALVS